LKRRRPRRAASARQGEQAADSQQAGEREEQGEAGSPSAPKAPSAEAPAAEPAAAEGAAAAPAAPAPAPRRAGKEAIARRRRRVVRARARYVRTPARKARIVCVHLPGKSVAQARAILAFTSREVARDWSKLLESAVANAENNHELLEEDLIIREAYADEGPTIKRFRPRAMGRATPIRKRTSHLTITLTARPETTRKS
jgi:ribosomal protein L22